jgi:hypothetical protein
VFKYSTPVIREAKTLPVLLLTVGIFVLGFVLGFLRFLVAQKLGGIALAE